MNLVFGRSSSGRALVLGLTFGVLALLAFAGRAQATETVFWDNYSATPGSIAFADITGNGGGALNATGVTIDSPEGITFDPVTGRIYIASSSGGTQGEIAYVNIDGSGGGVLSTPGAEVNSPYGVDIDPNTRIIYWANGSGGPGNNGSIGWARLDGSGGGLLNTSGVTLDSPYKVAVSPANGRLFFGNGSGTSIGYVNLDNSGGGTLDITGATTPSSLYAVAVDAAAGRVYWLDSSNEAEHLSYASINGGGGGDVNLAGAVLKGGYGLAIDASLGRIYWANYGNGEERANAIGFVNLSGGGGGITPASAPVDGPQDPLILKSPVGTGAPTLSRNPKNRAELTCSTGGWLADQPGSFVWQAPRSLAYQWTMNGTAVSGATAATFTATAPGSYACTVTASNSQGTATQAGAAVKVKAAKLKLTTKRKAKADPGDRVAFKVKAVNQGDLAPKNARVCVKLPKAAKDDLKAPKCKKLGRLAAGAKKTTKIEIKVKPGADEGADKLTFQVKGSAGKAAKAKIVVR